MELTLECSAAVLSVLILTGVLWWLAGVLLRPSQELTGFVLLLTWGDGGELEQSVRGYLWLRSLGAVKSPILIADAGLDRRGREIALRLCARWPDVILWPLEDLNHYLTFTMRGGDGPGRLSDPE